MRHVTRGGRYVRVCDPSWADPSDTSFSKRYGGRWNPPSEFGALYLNRTVEVALANARRHIELLFGAVASLYDFRADALPDLQRYTIVYELFVDVVTPRGIRAADLPASFPHEVSHAACQRLATKAYAANEAGIAALSAALPSGEELAIFDRAVATLARKGQREHFTRWASRIQ